MRDLQSLAEETISSETVYQGRLVNLRVDTVRLSNGRVSTREVVQHPGAVAIVPVLPDLNVVLVEQFRQAAGKVLLEIPAGTLDPGEDPLACLERELREEVGYSPGVVEHLFSSYLAPGYSSEMLHCYLATDLIPSPGTPDRDEVLYTRQMPLEQAAEMVLRGEVQDAKTVCGVLLAAHKLLPRKVK